MSISYIVEGSYDSLKKKTIVSKGQAANLKKQKTWSLSLRGTPSCFSSCLHISFMQLYSFLDYTVNSKMGRRSISTTKSGKFMNPTDQASKIQKLCNLLKLCQVMPRVLANLLSSLLEIYKSYSAITHSSSCSFY